MLGWRSANRRRERSDKRPELECPRKSCTKKGRQACHCPFLPRTEHAEARTAKHHVATCTLWSIILPFDYWFPSLCHQVLRSTKVQLQATPRPQFTKRFQLLNSTRLVQPSLSIHSSSHKTKVGNFGEKPFVWEFLLGGDTSKKRIKKFTRKNHHGGSPAPPRVPDLVCKISFAFPEFLVAVANLISF